MGAAAAADRAMTRAVIPTLTGIDTAGPTPVVTNAVQMVSHSNSPQIGAVIQMRRQARS
nr:hypothetical protein [Gordonia sp. OPL2]